MILLSCSRSSPESVLYEGDMPGIIEAKAYVLSSENLERPETVLVKNLKIIPALKPDTFPTNTNLKDLGASKIVRAGNPIIHIPGEKGLIHPGSVLVTESINKAGVPDISQAKDAYSPGNNPHSLSFFTRLHGLQLDDISSIEQDQNGNLWLGTYGGGAVRYDGLNFTHFTEKEGLSQNYILSLLADSKGNIWFGTRAEGAIRYDGTNLFFLTINNGLPDNRIEKIYEDSKGNIWFGTYMGAAMYDGMSITSYTPSNGLKGEVVNSIIEDNEGNFWFGTRGAGIFRFNGRSFSQYTCNEGLIHDYIVSSMKDSKGNLWFCTDGGGVCMFDGLNFTYYNEENGLPENYTNYILEDKLGSIWIGTRSKGLVKMDGSRLMILGEEQGLLNSYVTSVIEDRNGKIWFGTYGGGLVQYQGRTFSHFNEHQGLKDSFIRSIFQDKEGNMWFGSNREGVFKYDGSDFYNYSTKHGLSYNRIGGIHQDRKGNFWFATTGGGISKFDGDYFTHYTREQGLSDDFILSMMEDRDGNLWFVTRNTGVVKFDGYAFTNFTTANGLSDDNARCIIQDSKGNIWIGTRAGGVNKFDGEVFTHFTVEGGLPSNNIIDIMEDSRGNIWIATNGRGVLKYDGKSYTHYSEKQGLASDFVYSLLEDRSGNIWFGTRMGFSRLLWQQQSENGLSSDAERNSRQFLSIKNYTQEDGFIGIGCNSRTILQDRDDMIWVGANDILTVYKPDGDCPDTIPPNIQITGIGLFNQKLRWADIANPGDTVISLLNGVKLDRFRFDSLSNWYGLPVNLNLVHNNNYITFKFVGITTSFAKKVRYHYKLEGLEEFWSSLSYATEASYGNLSPGKYTFKIWAVNSEGYSSDEFLYDFTIRPPWWWSRIAFIFYFLVLIAIIVLIIRRRNQLAIEKEKKRKRELMLEQEVIVARKSAEFKQNFLARMSHEIRTPLTGILGMASMLRQLPLDKVAKEYIDALNESGETLRETINMILDISKIEAGKLEIRKSVFSLRVLLEQSIKLFEPICSSDVNLECETDNDLPEYIMSDQQRVGQIIKNLVSNAVKFTKKGKISLRATKVSKSKNPLKKDDITIRIEVKDTGSGISKSDQEKLFTPFYQTSRSSDRATEGTGLGLAICKELSLILGGNIGVESEPGVGSCFWFTFEAESSKTASPASPNPGQTNSAVNRSLNILLVEDKVVTQKVVNLMLKSMGHTIVVASNGEEAVKVFSPNNFDLILMDIQMPVMDGITATQKLRSLHKVLPPIVGLSANAFEGDREKYMSMGLNEYMTKPVKEFDFRRMLEKLELVSPAEN